MKRLIIIIIYMFFVFTHVAFAQARFGESLCHNADYACFKLKAEDSWDNLFPNPAERDMIKRINRMNIPLHAGMTIAVPKNISSLSIYDVSPFPRYIESIGEKAIFISQKQLAWGAYDEQGELVWWGPISSGSGHCKNIDGNCVTPEGIFRIIRKQDIDCISTVFPRHADGTAGGAIMPYCMHFLRGFALHGSETVPGYRDSHGCVRMFIEDARWLNEEFITLPGGESKGTQVILDAS